MRILELHIQNFRKIENLSITFASGLSVIVGENNVGKTAIIDALRLILFSSRDFDSPRLSEDDFNKQNAPAPIEVSCVFTDLTDDEEVHFHECLVDVGEGKFNARFNIRAEFNPSTNRVNVKSWGGETEGGSLPSNLYDKITSIYLQPLRNPESGLKPGRYSQIARLVDSLTDPDKHQDFETIASIANENIKKLPSVISAKNNIDTQMKSIAGPEMAQETDLVLSDPTFSRIISGLNTEVDGLPTSLNGLGYNNLIFTATTLGTLKSSGQFAFRSIIVEEPEAHLHPQLQTLLLQHLAKFASLTDDNPVQIITSTHSPILASQAPLDSIISIHESDNGTKSASIACIEIDPKIKKKLERFLDATRAELFFAKRIIMVEGIAEAILLPVLTKIAGGNLKESAVTIINADGINFNAFIPLFGVNKLECPTVIITDGDDKKGTGTPSNAAQILVKAAANIDNLSIQLSTITFEHELALSEKLLPYMLEAYIKIHPNKGPTLKTEINDLKNQKAKADHFLSVFIDGNTSKGIFAQELAEILSENKINSNAVPDYITDTLKTLKVME